MNKMTRQAMLDYAAREVARGSIYVWGAQGQRGSQITEAWIRQMETSSGNATRAVSRWNTNKKTHDPAQIGAFDCSGLICACINANGNPSFDDTADGLLHRCVSINKSALQPGDFVFEWNGSKSGHVGIYVGDGYVIEARGRDYGVVKTKLDSRNWAKYGRPDFLYTASQQTATAAKPATALPYDFSKAARKGETSDRVMWIQERLNHHNAGVVPKYTRYFGTVTENAVIRFQTARLAEGRDIGASKPDGLVGPKTAALLAEGGA